MQKGVYSGEVSSDSSSSIMSVSSSSAPVVDDNDIVSKATEESRIIRQLIGNVAHDLKTPLSSFMVGLSLIQDWIHDLQSLPSQTATQTILLHQIETALHDAQVTDTFMIATINRCIEYTKSTSGIKLTPKIEPISHNDAVNFALLCMQNVNTQFSFTILPPTDTDELSSYIFTDQQWLQENLLCLLSNAVKYSHSGEITICMYLKTRNNNIQSGSIPTLVCPRQFAISPRVNLTVRQDLVFEIEDHGIGIPEEKKPFLFGAFAQTQKMAGGTGLGLYSFAKRVQALHGSYGVRTRYDGEQGSCFWFAIPYQPDDNAATLMMNEEEADNDDTNKLTIFLPTHKEGGGGEGSGRVAEVENNLCKSQKTERILHHRSSLLLASQKQSTLLLHTTSSSSTASTIIPPLTFTAECCSHFSDSNIAEHQLQQRKKPCILLVDDSTPIVKVTKMLLQRHGYDVNIAENGFVAVQCIETCFNQGDYHRYEVILMDLHMPVMDGLEATKRIREIEVNLALGSSHPLLIIGLSANSDDGTLSSLAEAGFDSFLPKPFRMEDFCMLLQQMKG